MEYMTVKDAAERWGYSEGTIRKWCRQGTISAVVKAEKSGGRWNIPVVAVCPKEKNNKVK